MKKNFRKNNKNQQGVTLIEILVAMMIFGFIVGGVVLFGARALETHTKSQAMQNTLENARFSVESMAKKIRTSHGVRGTLEPTDPTFSLGNDNFNEVFFNNSSDGMAYCYRFVNGDYKTGKLTVRSQQIDPLISECDGIPSDNEKEIISGESDGLIGVGGYFEVVETDNSKRGMVKIKLTVTYNTVDNEDVSKKSEETIMTSVSLRDY